MTQFTTDVFSLCSLHYFTQHTAYIHILLIFFAKWCTICRCFAGALDKCTIVIYENFMYQL